MKSRRKRAAKTYGSPNWPWELLTEAIPTAGERLPDGSVIELVRDPKMPQKRRSCTG